MAPELDLESQRQPPPRMRQSLPPLNSTTSPLSPTSPKSPRSPRGRLSWQWGTALSAPAGKKPLRQSTADASLPSPPTSPSGATIFNTQERPELQMMESFALGKTKTEYGVPGSPTRESGSSSAKWAPNFPPLPLLQTSRSQQKSSRPSTDRRRSASKRHSTSNVVLEQDEEVEDRQLPQDRRPEAGDQAELDDPRILPDSSQTTKVSTHVEDTGKGESSKPQRAATAIGALSDPLQQKLSDLHAKYPNLRSLPRPLLPIVAFPGQGTGRSSEFAQDAPIWSRQPYKIIYFIYFGLSVGLIFLPWFAFISLFPSKRARSSWTWKKSTLVRLYRHGTRLTFRTHTSLSRDLTKEVPHSQTVRGKFVWVEALAPELVRGELKRGLDLQGLSPVRTCGFWYGERDGGGGVGQKAVAGEKVVYHLHGGAYWIGTAHEKDVTAAVNMQVLKALDAIYSNRVPTKSQHNIDLTQVKQPNRATDHQGGEQGNAIDGKAEGRTDSDLPSPHPPSGGPSASRGVCKRAFSLDYRLCVPGRPDVGSFPAPLADAMAGYRYLVHDCEFDPKNIIIAGDSAGGNLALALCRYLRDEKIDAVPGAMLLLSPWADTSRSHSGPITSPNPFSSVSMNRKSDIIAPAVAFRNTAVSALLGKMAAREVYKNPYLSSISLQLAANKGGAGPSWGFEGFPRRIYVCTGTAEISYDQHLTLAYRLAAGTHSRVPIHAGNLCSKDADPYEMAARLEYPRPEDHEITLWPSAQNTPAGTPLPLPSDGWEELRRITSSASDMRSGPAVGGQAVEGQSTDASQSEGQQESSGRTGALRSAAASAIDSVGMQFKKGNGYIPRIGSNLRSEMQRRDSGSRDASVDAMPPGHEVRTSFEAGQGPHTTGVKEKDTQPNAHSTHNEAREESKQQGIERPDQGSSSYDRISANAEQLDLSSENARLSSSRGTSFSGKIVKDHSSPTKKQDAGSLSRPPARKAPHDQQSYFGLGGEDRTVVLDECVDGIHDYTLFDWFEPERGHTWARIARWIDEEI